MIYYGSPRKLIHSPSSSTPASIYVFFSFRFFWWKVGYHSNRCIVLMCIFLMANNVEPVFMCLVVIHMLSLLKCLFKSFSQLKKKWLVYFYCALKVLYILWIKVYCQTCVLQICLPSALFSFSDQCLCRIDVLNFDAVQFANFFPL